MRIDFFWFNVDTPVGYSNAVALLSEELRQRGHEVRLCQIDDRLALPWDPVRLAEHSAASVPDLVAVSFNTSHASHAHLLLQALAQRQPGVRIVVGGLHPTVAPEEVISWPGVQALGRGECDGLLADLVDAWARGEDRPAIPNFWLKTPGGDIQKNAMGPLPSLDGISPLNEGFHWDRIIAANRGLGSLSVTRGCPHSCTYCHNHTIRKLYLEQPAEPRRPYCRRRSVDVVIQEIQRLQRLARGAMRIISFDDDNLMTDRAWLLQLVRRIYEQVGLPYLFMGDMDQIDDTVGSALGETRCLMVRFGVESASPRIRRDILRRGRSIDNVLPAFETLHRFGVAGRAYVLVGVPTESREDLFDTFRLCGQARADSVRPAFLQPYPMTEIYALCKRLDLLDPEQHQISYFSGSPLRWSSEHQSLLGKILDIFSWLLNAELPGNPAVDRYRALLDRALDMDLPSWQRPETKAWARRETLDLDRQLRHAGVPHYLAPFPERRDSAFLIQPGRRNPFPNIEDCWPPDAPWKDEPLPPGFPRGPIE